jgi:glycosyltransferase involved in cell wall biosynthesis
MPTSGVRVLVIGHAFDLPSDYVVEQIDRTAHLQTTIARFEPDIIITSNFIPGALKSAAFDLRKRWLNIDPKADQKALINAIEGCYAFNLYEKHQYQDDHPLVSVYTGTYNTGDFLRDTYQSLRDQTCPNWEWVVVDDHSTDGTWEHLEQLALEDVRVRPVRNAKNNGKIGSVKDTATRLCRGEFLVELDHDDMLTDTALAEIVTAFRENPEVGFVYSNVSNFYEDGQWHRFGDGFWKDRYRETEYRGKVWEECVNPDIYDRFGPSPWQQFGWYLTVGPNHVRAFRASTFRELGGYNPNLPVADDWDLYARFFLRSKCHHIDKMLYLYRFLDNWQNSTFTRNKSIQDHLELARRHYAKEFEAFNAKRLQSESSKAEAPAVAAPTGSITTEAVSFVVLEASETPLTRRCLMSIRKFAPDSEIVLVANGIEPTGADLADQVVALEENLGFAVGSNEGAAVATRDVVCFMNNDAAFVDDTPALLAAQMSIPQIVGPYSNRAKPPQGDLDKALPADCYPEMIVGLCMMMPTSLFRGLGGFDSRFNTWEDDDICTRARLANYPCKVVGSTWVDHERHVTFEALGQDVEQIMVENRDLFAQKHPKIKVIAISKNEEKGIQAFFQQFAHVTRDWCLLDTGSTDNTVGIAESIGVKVASADFTNFAATRNEALELFAGDAEWVIMLDPDERLDLHLIENLKETLFRTEYDILLAPLFARYADGSYKEFIAKPFIFRNRPEIRWAFKVHEKVIGSQKQAMVTNGHINHVIALHEDGRRQESEGLYAKLQAEEPYYTDAAFRADMRKAWPILDYENRDDGRIHKIVVGPLVSVVIPTFERGDMIETCVMSALSQDYVNLEVIVVGDACPQLESSLPASGTYPRVRVRNLTRNHGAGGAVPRNVAVAMAAGDLIAYLDDDNLWLSNHVSSLYELKRDSNAAFIFSSMTVDGKDMGFTEPKFQGIDTSCILHPKAFIARYGGWKNRIDGGYAHDWEIVSRWLQGGEPWDCTQLPTLIYNATTSGQAAFLATQTDAIPS